MLRQVSLERFRGFRKLVADLDETTVVLGPNSSGKTTLLQAIRLACDACEVALEAPDAAPRITTGGVIQVCSSKTTIVTEPTRLAALADFRQLFVDADVADGTDMRIGLRFDPHDPITELEVKLVYSRNAQLKLDVVVKSTRVTETVAHLKPKAKGRPATLLKELETVRPLALFVPAFYGVTRTEEYRTQPLVTRMLGSGDQSHIVRNLVARLDAQALNRMNDFLLRTVGASIVQRTSSADAERRADLAVTFRDTNGELELSSAGAGVIALVALFAAMERARVQRAEAPDRNVIFLLDEPEAHLHPRLAADVAEAIAATASEFNVQLALATHSIDVVNRLGFRDRVAVLSIDRRGEAPLTLRSETELVGALDAFCDLTPFATLSFLASRRLVLVEGATDRRLLEACAAVLFQVDEARLRTFRQAVIVELVGVGNVSTKGVLERLLSPAVVPNIGAARPVRVALARDSDGERDPHPVQHKRLKPHLDSVEVVWSRYSIESLFLEPALVESWVGAHLSPGRLTSAAVQRALAAADGDRDLQDAAEDARIKYHRRRDEAGKALTVQTARSRARAEVRADPARFQPGKRRAAFVLEAIRKHLGADGQSLRGTLVDLVEGAERTRVSASAVPQEIAEFLLAVTGPIVALRSPPVAMARATKRSR
jgi:predicted ATPase